MDKAAVRKRIEEVGIVPIIRATSPDEARFAADAIREGGISIVEITMTVPGALDVISELARKSPEVLLGAGTVLNAESASRCLDAGAQFLVSPGLHLKTVEHALKHQVLIIAGALTPTEIMAAWEAGADFIKVFPCSNVGGPSYLRALKGPFPEIPMVPTGGVNLETAAEFLRSGAAALGVGGELILKDALKARDAQRLRDLAARYVAIIKKSRHTTTAA
ncbi:MAG TPA: bifunctional 4-hydroxy-2-oxoglutarate aldolase/2-dehydro-3-deoxy-phosphogluconate aldolase [Candidatus Eisenbacteria bacterium]|nr:bifunctional 4-hydroxy-2-oxoglutarate aldolase/2-dehydro-3-deoxy-phosphogluconate aldolase [Candidatus Eisenbacteria bacterium]